MNLYSVRFRRDNCPSDFVSIAEDLLSLVQAKKARQASGDLVVHTKTNRVVTNPFWLWDWEKKDPKSYASKAIEAERKKEEQCAL